MERASLLLRFEVVLDIEENNNHGGEEEMVAGRVGQATRWDGSDWRGITVKHAV